MCKGFKWHLYLCCVKESSVIASHKQEVYNCQVDFVWPVWSSLENFITLILYGIRDGYRISERGGGSG